MASVILATAGHIDHGKTELTRRLTGIDTDRLPEEKARGITIDLGFAHTELGGRRVALIDVPGHERFVKNMLAGVGGIDLALIVIAADESVMPQNREHVRILELLGVGRAVVAVNKVDLVDSDLEELVRMEVTELLADGPLEEAPVVAVSAKTGAGVEALREELAAAVATVAERDVSGPFRMHVDRVFSIRGFGSVATGTVVGGTLRTGADVALEPGGKTAKVRGIEVHGADAEEVAAGTRAALNLAGVSVDELARGDQLVTPGRFAASPLVDVELRLLDDEVAHLKDLARVRVHLGAAEVMARVRLLDAGERDLGPGETGYAQLRLERSVLAWPDDRFIIRRYSPVTTIGGGVVLDVPERKHRGRHDAVVAHLTALNGAPRPARLAQLVEAAGDDGIELACLVRRTGRLAEAVVSDLADKPVVRVEAGRPRYYAVSIWDELKRKAGTLLAEFHRREPLALGMSREELRSRLVGDAAAFRRLLDDLQAAAEVRVEGEFVALGSHKVELSDDQQRRKDEIEAKFHKAGLNPPLVKDVLKTAGDRGDRLLAVLVREGRLTSLQGGALYFHSEALDGLKATLTDRLGDGTPFTVPEFKDLTGTTRKSAIPLLEYLDSIRFTRREGDARVVVRSGAVPNSADG